MRKYIDNERLFSKLKIEGQKRQIMICGGEDDDFMVDYDTGVVDICQAITLYLIDEGYDYILILDRSIYSTKLDFPKNTDFKEKYENINQPRVSRDPKANASVSYISDDDEDEDSY